MSRVKRMAEKVAPTTISVLILGECGVGKDVLARSIHERSRRADKRYLPINCGAIPESLIASDLFGYEPGAFTGAMRTGKMGLLESANGGTVFLDEIGDLPLSTQATLLRVLETGELRPVMSVRPRFVDVRFIAATNKDLKVAVARGEFRRDLLHRLNTLTLSVPPLRERVDEIPYLAREFVEAGLAEAGQVGVASTGSGPAGAAGAAPMAGKRSRAQEPDGVRRRPERWSADRNRRPAELRRADGAERPPGRRIARRGVVTGPRSGGERRAAAESSRRSPLAAETRRAPRRCSACLEGHSSQSSIATRFPDPRRITCRS